MTHRLRTPVVLIVVLVVGLSACGGHPGVKTVAPMPTPTPISTMPRGIDTMPMSSDALPSPFSGGRLRRTGAGSGEFTTVASPRCFTRLSDTPNLVERPGNAEGGGPCGDRRLCTCGWLVPVGLPRPEPMMRTEGMPYVAAS